MIFRNRLKWPNKSAFASFATKSLAEALKTAISAGLPGPGGVVVGAVLKEFLGILLTQTSSIEKKLDTLMSEPLKTGITMLNHAFRIVGASPNEIQARNSKLEGAHAAFVRALSILGDSREDSIFVRGLTIIALSSLPGNERLAQAELQDVKGDIGALRRKVEALDAIAKEWDEDSKRLDGFLAADSLRDKPFGYMEQRIAAKRVRVHAKKLSEEANQSRSRLEILEGLTEVGDRCTALPGGPV